MSERGAGSVTASPTLRVREQCSPPKFCSVTDDYALFHVDFRICFCFVNNKKYSDDLQTCARQQKFHSRTVARHGASSETS